MPSCHECHCKRCAYRSAELAEEAVVGQGIAVEVHRDAARALVRLERRQPYDLAALAALQPVAVGQCFGDAGVVHRVAEAMAAGQWRRGLAAELDWVAGDSRLVVG